MIQISLMMRRSVNGKINTVQCYSPNIKSTDLGHIITYYERNQAKTMFRIQDGHCLLVRKDGTHTSNIHLNIDSASYILLKTEHGDVTVKVNTIKIVDGDDRWEVEYQTEEDNVTINIVWYLMVS